MLQHLSCDAFEMDCAVFGNGPGTLVILPGMSLHPVTPSEDMVSGAFRCFREDYTIYLFDRKKNISPGYNVEDMVV